MVGFFCGVRSYLPICEKMIESKLLMKNKLTHNKLLLILSFGIFAVWLGYAFYCYNGHDSLGTFGDSFGSLNTLFTGLAFAGAIVTIFQQARDLRTAQEETIKATLESSMFSYLSRMDNSLPDNHAEVQNEIFKQLSRINTLCGSLENIPDGLEKDLQGPINNLRELLFVYAVWRRTFLSWCLRIDEETELLGASSSVANWKKRLWHLLSTEERRILFLQFALKSIFHQKAWKDHVSLVHDEECITHYFKYWNKKTYNFLISCLSPDTNGGDDKISKPQIAQFLADKEIKHKKPYKSTDTK